MSIKMFKLKKKQSRVGEMQRTTLPVELIVVLLSHCDFKDLHRWKAVSTKWQEYLAFFDQRLNFTRYCIQRIRAVPFRWRKPCSPKNGSHFELANDDQVVIKCVVGKNQNMSSHLKGKPTLSYLFEDKTCTRKTLVFNLC